MPAEQVTEKDIDVRKVLETVDLKGILAELDGLVGLQSVKKRVEELAAFLLVDRLRRDHGLVAEKPVMHMSFTGRPGTGKTTVAGVMTRVLYRLGYIRREMMVVASRNELIGEYVGHTAPKTKEAIKKALGGVLFIDEAYYLYRKDNERDYGQETIEMLLQEMENCRDDLVVIFAGYKDRMEEFYRLNPGLHSRVAHHIEFPDFSVAELVQIADIMLAQQQYFFAPDAREAYARFVEAEMRRPYFSNARTVRNHVDTMKLRHAVRMAAAGVVGREDLARIVAADIPPLEPDAASA